MKQQNENTFSESINQRQELQDDFMPVNQTSDKARKWC